MNPKNIIASSTTALDSKIVIGIPTFRRPQQLSELLHSLLPELLTTPALVIVADNDCSADTADIINAFNHKWKHIVYLPVSERGISQVRNALISTAGLEMPNWQWLVMLDDDGTVTPNWLQPLISTGDRLNADVVAGPVIGPLPDNSNRLARNSIYAGRKRWTTGIVKTLNGAQNLGISRRCLDLLQNGTLFHPQFGASGGEDYDFFRNLSRAGGVMAWCDEAVVIEPPPAGALSAKALLHRYMTTGTYTATIDRHYDGTIQTWKAAIKGILSQLFRLGVAIISFDKDKIAACVLLTAHFTGRIGGLMGISTSRYVQVKTQDC